LPAEKEEFLEWHNNLKQNNYVFDFQQEILTYCPSDVDILRRCCLEFRELFHDEMSHHYISLQSCVSKEFPERKHHRHYPSTWLPSKRQAIDLGSKMIILYCKKE
jgi:hypothetical protein